MKEPRGKYSGERVAGPPGDEAERVLVVKVIRLSPVAMPDFCGFNAGAWAPSVRFAPLGVLDRGADRLVLGGRHFAIWRGNYLCIALVDGVHSCRSPFLPLWRLEEPNH